MKKLGVALVVGIAACSPNNAQQTGDTTTAVAAIDTLKPAAGDSLTARDSLAAGAAVTTGATGTSPATTRGSTPTSTTGTKTAQRDTTNIGRDRAIPLDTRDPKVYLPTVDTGRKRPPL